MKTILLISLALCAIAHGDPTYVYERDGEHKNGINKGTVIGPNGQKAAVQIDVYGREAIEAARMFGRGLALNHYPFMACKQMIIDRAEELYHGNRSFIKWFEMDAAYGFDEERRKDR